MLIYESCYSERYLDGLMADWGYTDLDWEDEYEEERFEKVW